MQKLKNFFHLLEAVLANLMYGFPSKRLRVLAITGTDGKTTTTTLLYHMLKKAGKKVALVNTVAAYIGDDEIDTGFHVTTPSPFALQKILRRIADRGMEYVVLEVTSHGIDQNRIWGIHPSISAITNVTHEHLDYHKTFERYLQTKARLLLGSDLAIINLDAKSSAELLTGILQEHGFVEFKDSTEGEKRNYRTVQADTLSKKISTAVRKRFGTQAYNFENVAIASSIAKSVGVEEKYIANAIYEFPGVPGRMQEVAHHHGIRVIIDFAHTPNALEHALRSFKLSQKEKKTKGKLILVFGCAGLRDHSKRPLMGEIASRLADYVVLTAEDPRTEDVWTIIAQIKSGVTVGHQKITSIPDRQSAIAFAINELAHNGDTVLITGKGHEKSMCYGRIEFPWSDQEAVQRVISAQ